MKNIQSKIKGSLYGFAIGDAMGATTEFMNKDAIGEKYGYVDNIIGGGWLNLRPGEVTDDTQMMLCVCEAIEYAFGSDDILDDIVYDIEETFLDRCCKNFIEWYKTNPPDVGGCCGRVISHFTNAPSGNTYSGNWLMYAYNPGSLGNGSLMRTLPLVLSGQSEDLAMLQGRLTHNNKICDFAIGMYCDYLKFMLDDIRPTANLTLREPTGHVLNTLNNALYWSENTERFEDAIIGAVNDGGDADTIAAITGSFVGAKYGYEAIPKHWIEQLDKNIREKIDFYAKLFEKINKKVCTNTI